MGRIAIACVVLLMATYLAGCGKTYEWHRKLTIVVETPDGVRTGSSVSRFTWREADVLGGYPVTYSGEATVVEVAPDRYLLALVFGDNSPYRNIPDVPKTRQSPIAEISPEYYPALITFTDVANPATLRDVDPDRLDLAFGAGFHLKSMTLEITDEPATEGRVLALLPWVLDGRVMDAGLEALPLAARRAIKGLFSPSNFPKQRSK